MDDNLLLDLLTDMTRIHSNYVERRLIPLGVHSGQASIITALGHRGTCTQKELAQFRQVSPATVSVMLGRMERDNLVTREPAAVGGKANTISLTEKGRELFELIEASRLGDGSKLLAGFTDEDKSEAWRIFQMIAENLRNA
ncbi:MAG: transcriptional regulator, MarR family [Oscillospiraceae bacterium]|nr:transcriptional regulator, MarR family [Oscillospiraceae bacterium]